MKRIILVHGMKRSGNHAISHWLQAHNHFIFINNIIPIAPILLGKKDIPLPEEFALWNRKNQHKLLPKYLRYIYFLSKPYLQRQSLMLSLEDHNLSVKPFINAPCAITNILILRDPYNLFASRIRKSSLGNNPAYPKNAGPAMDSIVKQWKNHAREYLGLTKHLENKVCVYFNAWFSDSNYRQNISQKLNLQFTDRGFSKVSRRGGGSSFDKTHFNGNSQMMDVLNRQNHLTDSELQLLENTLADEEIQELAQKISVTKNT